MQKIAINICCFFISGGRNKTKRSRFCKGQEDRNSKFEVDIQKSSKWSFSRSNSCTFFWHKVSKSTNKVNLGGGGHNHAYRCPYWCYWYMPFFRVCLLVPAKTKSWNVSFWRDREFLGLILKAILYGMKLKAGYATTEQIDFNKVSNSTLKTEVCNCVKTEIIYDSSTAASRIGHDFFETPCRTVRPPF